MVLSAHLPHRSTMNCHFLTGWRPSVLRGSPLWLIFKSWSPHFDGSILLCEGTKKKVAQRRIHGTPGSKSLSRHGLEDQLPSFFEEGACK